MSPPDQPVLPAPVVLRQAGFVTRLIALVIDILIVTLGSMLFAALTSIILSFFGIDAAAPQSKGGTIGILDLLQIAIMVVAGLTAALFVPGYFIAFWTLIGATPGKQFLGVKVIRTRRQPLGWRRSTARYVGYFISAVCLFLGFLWVLVDGRRQAWHDKLADTFVVYNWDVPDDTGIPAGQGVAVSGPVA